MKEIWKEYPYADLKTEVSNLGRVRTWYHYGKRLDEPRLKKLSNTRGYRSTSIKVKGKLTDTRVHRMVAEVYLPRVKDKDLVNHKNGVKDDNRVENLEWCTQSENSRHAYDTGLGDNGCGSTCNSSKLSEKHVIEIFKLRSEGLTQREIGETLHVAKTTIAAILSGRSRKEQVISLIKQGKISAHHVKWYKTAK